MGHGFKSADFSQVILVGLVALTEAVVVSGKTVTITLGLDKSLKEG